MKPSFTKQLADLWRPKVKLGCLPWVKGNVVLSSRFTKRPGFYDPDYTPYFRGPHEWFSDPAIRRITAATAAQVGKTTLLANCISYVSAESPGPMLYATAREDDAKSWFDRELRHRLNDCAAVRAVLPECKDDLKKLEIHFRTCTLKLTGAQSPAGLASRSIQYGFGDETDKWKDDMGEEAGAFANFMARFAQFEGVEKILLMSTPTSPRGIIWREQLKGSQSRFHCPCPHCKVPQELIFKQVRWPDRHKGQDGEWNLDKVEEDAVYHCQACDAPITSRQKPHMIYGGEWVDTNPNAQRSHKSIHVSGLLSPAFTWGGLAKRFLALKGQPGGLHEFSNQYLGLPWEEDAVKVGDSEIRKIIGEYRVGDSARIPFTPKYLSFCADIGQAQQHWSVCAHCDDGDLRIIDYGTVLGIDDLVPQLNRCEYLTPDGTTIAPDCGLLDSGDFTDRVYRACDASGGRLWPSKGSGAAMGRWSKTVLKDYPTLALYTYVDRSAKDALYLDSIKSRRSPRLWLPADVSPAWIHGHTGQRKVERREATRIAYEWAPVAHDHPGDCSKLHLVTEWVRNS